MKLSKAHKRFTSHIVIVCLFLNNCFFPFIATQKPKTDIKYSMVEHESITIYESLATIIQDTVSYFYTSNTMNEVSIGLKNCFEAIEQEKEILNSYDLYEATPNIITYLKHTYTLLNNIEVINDALHIQFLFDSQSLIQELRATVINSDDPHHYGTAVQEITILCTILLNKIAQSCSDTLTIKLTMASRQLLQNLLEYTLQSINIETASQGLLRSYKRLIDNEHTVFVADLIQALPELMLALENETFKAPRPSAYATADGSLVGPLLTCNTSDITELLKNIKSILLQCCLNQQTCCAEILENFQETFTILADIKNTILTTSIIADCNGTFSVINAGFEGTFTTLTEINNTLTECCADIAGNFADTFTVLADIKNTLTECCAGQDLTSIFTTLEAGFNGTFTLLTDIKDTLTECCADIADNFEGTFTVLADIKNTILTTSIITDCSGTFTVLNAGFNGTFTSFTDIKDTLTECCTNIADNFAGTFTLLNDIQNTLTECCAAQDLTGIFTTLDAGFGGTFTALADIKNTLTECCAGIADNFAGTFTVLADIKNTLLTTTVIIECNNTFTVLNAGFEGTFTVLTEISNTLTECCVDIADNFAGTFTVLADIKNTLLTTTIIIECNSTFTVLNAGFEGTFTTLTEINNTLTTCCANLSQDFDGTFTILADIKNTILTTSIITDCSGTFTVLNAGFGGTFTVLADIQNTLTECCAAQDFTGIFTTLDAGFGGTFTLLADIKDTLTECCSDIADNFVSTFTVLNDIQNTLTECCAGIADNFAGTFTVLADIKNTLLTTTVIIECNNTFTVLNAGFEGTFTVLTEISNTLTECCVDIADNFAGTFTVLADIKNTLLTTTIIIECNSTFTVLNAGFEGTFTTLTEINNTLTTCCANLSQDFDGTFTILADIKNTILTTSIITDCSGTFTVLNAGFGAHSLYSLTYKYSN